ncbi:MAG: transglutaminase-like domain-containing protein [Chthoniobacteraceae bacterium]
MSDPRDPLFTLLSDDDLAMVELVKQQLVEGGTDNVARLRRMLTADDAAVSAHVRQVISEINSREARTEMTLLCATFDEHSDIEHAAWLVARVFAPDLDLEPWQEQVDALGREAARLLQDVLMPIRRVEILAQFLGQEMGFQGNAGNYYLVGNSLLPRILETRKGIPLTLTLLYQMVGRRAGLTIEGVNFPGHFIARCDGILFDPFDRGSILSEEACREILRRQRISPSPEHLQPTSPRVMFRRMLTNLLYIFQSSGKEDETHLLNDWVQSLSRH